MNPILRIEHEKIFAVLRNQKPEELENIINAISLGGINIIEIVIEDAETVKALANITKKENRPMIMAGGIITQRQAQLAINAGADVIVSPVTLQLGIGDKVETQEQIEHKVNNLPFKN